MEAQIVTPAYAVGDEVEIQQYGRCTVARIYEGCGLPLWYGTQRLIHTHCYEVRTQYGQTVWGIVDAEVYAHSQPAAA